jgi:hypothetical protein
MQILDNLIIITIHVLCFVAGMKIANHYHAIADADKKDALERQFLRLRVKADADDPCRPYIAPRAVAPLQKSGDYDGDNCPIPPEFMERLKENGKASMKVAK